MSVIKGCYQICAVAACTEPAHAYVVHAGTLSCPCTPSMPLAALSLR
jgi:hypothetical protein